MRDHFYRAAAATAADAVAPATDADAAPAVAPAADAAPATDIEVYQRQLLEATGQDIKNMINGNYEEIHKNIEIKRWESRYNYYYLYCLDVLQKLHKHESRWRKLQTSEKKEAHIRGIHEDVWKVSCWYIRFNHLMSSFSETLSFKYGSKKHQTWKNLEVYVFPRHDTTKGTLSLQYGNRNVTNNTFHIWTKFIALCHTALKDCMTCWNTDLLFYVHWCHRINKKEDPKYNIEIIKALNILYEKTKADGFHAHELLETVETIIKTINRAWYSEDDTRTVWNLYENKEERDELIKHLKTARGHIKEIVYVNWSYIKGFDVAGMDDYSWKIGVLTIDKHPTSYTSTSFVQAIKFLDDIDEWTEFIDEKAKAAADNASKAAAAKAAKDAAAKRSQCLLQ